MEKIVGDADLLRQPPHHGFEFVTGTDREKQMVRTGPPVLRGTGGSEVPASKLPPESWLSPWRQMGPREVAWDVDSYNLPHGEELAGVLIYVPGGPTAQRRRDGVKGR
jgi:hypothetical protein